MKRAARILLTAIALCLPLTASAKVSFTGDPRAASLNRELESIVGTTAVDGDIQVIAQVNKKRLRLAATSGDVPLGERTFRLTNKGKLTAKMKQNISAWLSSLSAAHAEPVPAIAEPEEAEPSSDPRIEASHAEPAANTTAQASLTDAPAAGGKRLAIAAVVMEGVSRGLSWTDPVTANLRPYKVYFMPTPGVALQLFPLALIDSDALANVGLTFGFQRSLGVKSNRREGPLYPTTYSSWSLGLNYRLELGSVVLVPAVAWNGAKFSLDAADDGSIEAEMPSVDYGGLKIGTAAELLIADWFALLADAAYVQVLSKGSIISRQFHRDGSAAGLILGAGVRIRVAERMSTELGAVYQHYYYDFNPQPGDRFIAGGALDQFVSARFAFRVEL
jgi:hypothetical protein